MIAPKRGDLGRRVVYRAAGGERVEPGVLVRYSSDFAFVRYGASVHSIATMFRDLDWDGPRRRSGVKAP